MFSYLVLIRYIVTYNLCSLKSVLCVRSRLQCVIVFLQSRSAATKKLLEELGPGAVFISSANEANIMAGQGTTAVEFLEQVCSRYKLDSGSCKHRGQLNLLLHYRQPTLYLILNLNY